MVADGDFIANPGRSVVARDMHHRAVLDVRAPADMNGRDIAAQHAAGEHGSAFQDGYIAGDKDP